MNRRDALAGLTLLAGSAAPAQFPRGRGGPGMGPPSIQNPPLAKLDGPIDFVFIDAEKEGYTDYLNQLLPKVRAGGLILAHNIGMNQEYVQAVASNAQLETAFYMEGGGLGVTMKKR